MKLAGAALIWHFLFAVMRAAAMKTMKEIGQALSMDSSLFDGGLGGDDLNLQVIESSLMSMVREGTSPSLKPGIYAIYNLTDEMKAAVENKSNHEQNNLTDAWYEWLNCTPADAERQSFNDSSWYAEQSCSISESTGLADWDGNAYSGNVSAWAAEHCVTNCSQKCEEEENSLLPHCPNTPFTCEKDWDPFEDNTDVKAHMLYLQTEFAKGNLLQNNCTSNKTNCTEECKVNCPAGWNASMVNCSNAICQFEEAGCGLLYSACEEYHRCYTREEIEYNQTRTWTSLQEHSNKQEYRAILRIQCLLNAFLASIDLNESLGDGINDCINTTFNTSNLTHFGKVTIGYYNESENPRKNCSEDFPTFDPSFNVTVGGQTWQARYYSTWSATQIPSFTFPDCSNHHTSCFNLSAIPYQ